ncbi:MAG: hypothetical protein AAFQ15_00480 [Pseudomonadota bacterium]
MLESAGARPREPLGLSDLRPDEELIIIAYREWRRRGAGAVAEHVIARSLRGLAAYDGLDAAFNAFAAATQDFDTWLDPGIVMTTEEERVLTLLARDTTGAPAALDIRAANVIPRTGRDRMLMRVNDSYHATAALYGRAAHTQLH